MDLIYTLHVYIICVCSVSSALSRHTEEHNVINRQWRSVWGSWGVGQSPRVQNWEACQISHSPVVAAAGKFPLPPSCGWETESNHVARHFGRASKSGVERKRARESETLAPMAHPRLLHLRLRLPPAQSCFGVAVTSLPNAMSLATAAADTHVALRRLPACQGGVHAQCGGSAPVDLGQSLTPLCPSSSPAHPPSKDTSRVVTAILWRGARLWRAAHP